MRNLLKRLSEKATAEDYGFEPEEKKERVHIKVHSATDNGTGRNG